MGVNIVGVKSYRISDVTCLQGLFFVSHPKARLSPHIYCPYIYLAFPHKSHNLPERLHFLSSYIVLLFEFNWHLHCSPLRSFRSVIYPNAFIGNSNTVFLYWRKEHTRVHWVFIYDKCHYFLNPWLSTSPSQIQPLYICIEDKTKYSILIFLLFKLHTSGNISSMTPTKTMVSNKRNTE